jgi:hypothetical protein
MVSGSEGPLSANSELLSEAEVTVTLEPAAVSVAGRLLLAPTTTLPKLKPPGLMENWPAAVPLPDREIDGVAPDAFDASVILPVFEPADCGAKVTLKVKACPAERVNGKLIPVMVKSVPVKFACETVTLAPPEFVRVAVCVRLLPTCTLPKLTEFATRVPEVTPVPERGIENVGVEPLSVIARFTVLLPADWGAKATLKDLLCPGFSVKGKPSPVTLYPAPAAACVRVILVPPEFVRVSGRV